MEETQDTAGVGVDNQSYSSPGLEGGHTKNGDRLMPDASQEGAAKTNVNPMSGEFGYYGTLDEGVESGLSPTDDPRDFVHDEEVGGPRRRGTDLLTHEKSVAAERELEEQSEANIFRIDMPCGRCIYQPKHPAGRELTIREEVCEEWAEEEGLVSSRAHDEDPREKISEQKLGDSFHYASELADEVDIPRHLVHKRLAAKIAPAIQVDTDEALPLKFNERPKDAFANPIGAFTAYEVLRDELLYEYPRTLEGVSHWHNTCSVRGVVTELWFPTDPRQYQAGMIEDADGNPAKFVVWKKSVEQRFSRERRQPQFGLLSYTLGHKIDMVAEGDLIEISSGSPSPYLDIISIACTQKTDLTVLERGDGPVRTWTDNISFEHSRDHNPTARFDRKKVTDDHSDGVPSLAQKRYRPQWEVMARHGDFDRSDPENQPPSNPAKRQGVSDKGWNFCETWTFPVSSWTPEWFLSREDVEVHDDERPFRVRAEADIPPVGTGGTEYERFTQAEFLEVFSEVENETDVEFSVADYVSAELVLTGSVPEGTIEVYTSIVGGYAAPCGEDSIAIVLRPDGDEGPKARRLYRIEGWEGRLRTAVEQMILEGSVQLA